MPTNGVVLLHFTILGLDFRDCIGSVESTVQLWCVASVRFFGYTMRKYQNERVHFSQNNRQKDGIGKINNKHRRDFSIAKDAC